MKMLLICFFTIFLTGCAAPSLDHIPESERVYLTDSSGSYEYSEVIDVEGMGSNDIYKQAKVWVTRNYISANDVIQMDDNHNNHLIVKGVFEGEYLLNKIWIPHTLEIQTKDGRLKIYYNSFRYTNEAGDNGVPFRVAFERAISKESIVGQTELFLSETVIDLKKHLKNTESIESW